MVAQIGIATLWGHAENMAQEGKLLKAIYSPASNLVCRQRGIGCVRGKMNVELGCVCDGHWLETAG